MQQLPSELRERADTIHATHISWVLLQGDRAFKIKRPVELGFLDFRELEQRRRACVAEVTLNRRGATEVYLGVVPVRQGATGQTWIDADRIGHDGDGEIVDWAVMMRRLPDEQRADVRLAAGQLSIEAVDALARAVADFHARAREDAETRAFGSPATIRANVRENFEQTRQALGARLGPERAAALEEAQYEVLAKESSFGRRMSDGRVRDGHGDLRLEHCYLTTRGERHAVQLIDCIEFNDRFRYGDVCADLAFLSMDLRSRGKLRLAERLLSSYAEETNDFDLYRLVDFYESYRAHVRGKVNSLLAGDRNACVEQRQQALDRARRFFQLAYAENQEAAREPLLVAVCGLIGAGKSTLADALSLRLGGPRISSDRIRKHLAGVSAGERLAPQYYTPARTDEVHAQLRSACQAVLQSGRSVVVDASMRSAKRRGQLRDLARELHIPFRLIEARAPRHVLEERLHRRADEGATESDARINLLSEFESSWEPIEQLPQGEHAGVDTARPISRVVDELAGWLRLPR